MKDFENGWDLGIEKHKSYYKHKLFMFVIWFVFFYT
jgi:hypothetical protein